VGVIFNRWFEEHGGSKARLNLLYLPERQAFQISRLYTPKMLEYRTPGFKGFAVKYSPFFDNKIAVATGQNYGLVGNGRLYILELTANGIVADRW